MKKKVLVLATILSLGMTVQAFACTPPLNPPSSPHIEFEWTPSEEFQKGIRCKSVFERPSDRTS